MCIRDRNKRVGVLWMAFRARKAFGTFEKRAPELILKPDLWIIGPPAKSVGQSAVTFPPTPFPGSLHHGLPSSRLLYLSPFSLPIHGQWLSGGNWNQSWLFQIMEWSRMSTAIRKLIISSKDCGNWAYTQPTRMPLSFTMSHHLCYWKYGSENFISAQEIWG